MKCIDSGQKNDTGNKTKPIIATMKIPWQVAVTWATTAVLDDHLDN